MAIKLQPLFVIVFLLTISFLPGLSQDLEGLKDQKPVRVTGRVGLSTQTYNTNRSNPSRDPFIWSFHGNTTIDFYGITMPFNFIVSQKQQDFRQPFNQFGLSPYYKWVQLHLGYRSMVFSQYTLNGHVFNGAGVEANPGIFRFGVMYGRFLKPIEEDTMNIEAVQPAYRRMGYSVKVGAGSHTNFVDLILFKGWDDVNSITRPADSAAVNPEANLVIGIKSQQRIWNNLVFDLDFGLSGYTSNIYATGPPREDIAFSGLIRDLMETNYSTQFLKAGSAGLSFRINPVLIKLQYQRIDPDYKTMGAYFFNNDLENITISPSWSMLKRKMRVMMSLGRQRNNLFDDKMDQSNRKISSFMVSYNPIHQLSMSANYTNFQINQHRLDLVKRDFIDSLQLTQFSNNLSFNTAYNFGDKIQRYAISFSASHQSFSQNHNNDALGNNDSKSLSPSLNFRYSNRESGWGWRTGANFNEFKNADIESFRWGVNASVDKRISEDKLGLNVSANYYTNLINGDKAGNSLRLGTRANYNPHEKHGFNLGFNWIKSNSTSARIESFSEFLGNFAYTYSF